LHITKRILVNIELAKVQKNSEQKHIQKAVLLDAQRARRVHPFMFMPLMDDWNLTNNAQGKIRRQDEQPYTHFKRRDTCIVNGIEPIHRQIKPFTMHPIGPIMSQCEK
jgi:hypothetical protein